MYCSDCHGSNTPAGTADPDGPGYENGAVWGPHGSTNPFLLKGDWSGNVGSSPENDFTPRTGTGALTASQDHLCFKCHSWNQYAGTGTQNSGFGASFCGGMCGGGGGGGGGSLSNLHTFHVNRVGNDFRCALCHVAVPHGWKNKAFLVNLNDVGPEGHINPRTAARTPYTSRGNQVRNNDNNAYVDGPYYSRAVLKIDSFASSGTWQPGNCGSAESPPGNGQTGVAWMAFSNEACNAVP
jgi:hypothetical protein